MDAAQLSGLVGVALGILGALLGIAGGVLGCYVPYRLAKTPRQKAFVLKAAAFFWILVLVFALGVFLLPSPWNFLIWLPYLFVLVLSINWINKRQQRMLAEEEQGLKNSAKQGAQ